MNQWLNDSISSSLQSKIENLKSKISKAKPRAELFQELVSFPVAAEASGNRVDREPAQLRGVLARAVQVTGQQEADQRYLGFGEAQALQMVVEKRFPGNRHPARDDFLTDHVRVFADFLLRVGVHAQVEEVEQIPEVDLPVGFGVGGKRQVLAGLLPRHAGVQPLLVDLAGQPLQLGLTGGQALAESRVQGLVATLPVDLALHSPGVRTGPLSGVDGDRVPRAVLVYIRGAMANPLPPRIHGYPNVQFDLAHFKRRGVPVPQQVADEAAVFVDRSSAGAVGNAGRLHDRRIASEIVHHAHEAVIEAPQFLPEDSIEVRRRDAGQRLIGLNVHAEGYEKSKKVEG